MASTSSGVGLQVLAFEVQHLAADHAVHGADGIRNQADDLHRRRGRAVEAGQHFKGAGLQRVAGQDGDGLAEGHVAGGLAAAQVVVVQSRQVVMDERVGVQHLEAAPSRSIPSGKPAGNGHRRLHGQHRPQPLAAGKG